MANGINRHKWQISQSREKMNDPNLTQIFGSGLLSFEAGVHTALPAKVLKFNAGDNTVQIELMINELKRDGVSVPLPPLDDVPVQFFRGGDDTAIGEAILRKNRWLRRARANKTRN